MGIIAPKNYGLLRNCDELRVQFEGILKLTELEITPECLGPNVITNGTFDTDLSGWSQIGTPAWEPPGRVRITSTGGEGQGVFQDSMEDAKTYFWSVDVTVDSGSLRFTFGNGGPNVVFSESGHFEGTNMNTDGVLFAVRNGPCNGTFDNIVVREVLNP